MGKNSNSPWSASEVTLLKKWFNIMATEDIAKELGRSERSVIQKSQSIGLYLTKYERPSPKEYIKPSDFNHIMHCLVKVNRR